MMYRKSTIGVLLAITFAFSVFAVGEREIAEREAPDAISVRSTQGQDINTMDPAFYRGNEEFNIDLVLYSKLMQFGPGSSDLILDAAESVDLSDDGLRISFKLREGIQFHRGYGELTAEDVKFSFERIVDPKTESAYKSEWITLDRVEVTGKYTGVIFLNDTYAPLFVGTIPFTPGSIVSKKAYEELGEAFATNPVGSGPYRWAGWTPGQEIILERFDDYYGELPDFRTIHILPITDPQLAELALEKGDLDLTEISASSYQRYKDDPAFNVDQISVTRYVFLGFNHEHEPFSNKKVREAVRYAVDVPAILAAAYRNMVPRANSMIASGVLGHWADAPQYDLDIDKAKSLLAEAGYADGFKTTLLCAVSYPKPDVAQIIQANLKKANIEVEIKLVEHLFPELGEESTPGLFLANYGPSIEPDRWVVWWTSEHIGGWNFKKFSHLEYDDLRRKALETMDTEKRAGYYIRMQQILDEEVSAVWITNSAMLVAYRPFIHPVFLTQRHQYRYWAKNE